jgi:phospholipid/cholesterol/gamma-HCH transport system substrate-binding protein
MRPGRAGAVHLHAGLRTDMPKHRLVIVGAFVMGGLLLFAFGLFRIGDRRLLFVESFRVYAEFSEVSALAPGALVRVAGMDAGEVEEIRVPAGPADRFRVRMRVRENLGPLVRTDSIATISTDGLVGNRFVQIQTGTEAAPRAEDGGMIQSREPFEFADLMMMMSDTIETVNVMLVDVKANVDEALLALRATANDAHVLITEVGDDVESVLASTQQVADDVAAILHDVRAGRGTVGQLLTDESLYHSVRAMATDGERAVVAIREASEDVREAIAGFRGEETEIRGLTADVQQTMTAARRAMTNLVDATEAIQRNFLLRGFFRRRGFFNLDDVTVAEYREGTLETRDRRALRIWLRADVLFERDTDGVERLTDGGRARLDSAMSQFVRYTERSPFVIEGYAHGVTADVRHLVSRSRAELVHDYLVDRYTLDVNFVTTMPMGGEAQDSPAGTTWDGVALAVFVLRSEL